MFLRIVAPHFVAAIDGERTAPIIRYMRGWSIERVLAYCRKKGWQVEDMSDYKKFDSNDKFRISGVRLAKDPRVNEGEHGKMVSLTFVVTSRKDKHKDIFMQANVADFQSDIASYLEKGDTLHEIEGKLVNRPWEDKDGNERDSLELERASIVIPAELFATLRERGWEPSGSPNQKKGGKAPAKKGAVGGKKNPAQGKRKVADPDEDLDADLDDLDEE